MEPKELEKLDFKLGSDPNAPITLLAHEVSDLMVGLRFQQASLLEANRMLKQANPDSACESTSTAQAMVYGVAGALGMISTALLYAGYAQGLRLVESDSGLPLEDPQVLTRAQRRAMMAAAKPGETPVQ